MRSNVSSRRRRVEGDADEHYGNNRVDHRTRKRKELGGVTWCPPEVIIFPRHSALVGGGFTMPQTRKCCLNTDRRRSRMYGLTTVFLFSTLERCRTPSPCRTWCSAAIGVYQCSPGGPFATHPITPLVIYKTNRGELEMPTGSVIHISWTFSGHNMYYITSTKCLDWIQSWNNVLLDLCLLLVICSIVFKRISLNYQQ